MSTADNKQLMERIYAALAKDGDGTLFVESLADNVTMRVTGQYSWSRTFQGKEALLKDLYGYVRSRLAQRGRTVAHRVIGDGDYVVVEARGDMVTKEGTRYDNEYCMVYRFENGKIVEFREYCDSVLTESVLGKYPAAQRAA